MSHILPIKSFPMTRHPHISNEIVCPYYCYMYSTLYVGVCRNIQLTGPKEATDT